jgi:hypothetical protein
MDRHYAFLYTLFEHERDKDGFGYDHFFGKAIYHAQYPDYSRTNILHLVQFFDTPEEGWGWSLGRGLFSWSKVEVDGEERTRWKLFWIPFGG